MPRIRQTPAEVLVARTLALRLPDGHRIEAHAHPWHQLVYATEGVLAIETDAGSWVVPPERAVWIPAHFLHSVRASGPVRMRTVYLRPGCADALPGECCVVEVTPLLRELVLECVRSGMLDEREPEHVRLLGVLADRLRGTEVAPLRVAWPRDPRAARVADRARADLSASSPLEQLARGSGASPRTIERLFREETGLTFGRWLQRVRTLRALELLAAGESVTTAGLAVGYASTSAFIAMFRRVTGTTPGRSF